MKLRQQKKGMVMIFFTAILIVIIIMPMLFFAMHKKQGQFQKTLGDIPVELTRIYDAAEMDLFYIDQSAKYSAAESAFALASNGGFDYPSTCGKFLEYQLWNNKEKECYPNYELNFKILFAKNLNDYLILNKLPDPKYEFSLIDKNIIGIAGTNYEYDINGGKYSIKPSFSVNINYNINDYKEIINQAKELIKKCSGQVVDSCAKQNLPQYWQFGSCEGDETVKDRNANFCVISPIKLMTFNINTNKIEPFPVLYRFALYFPEQMQQQ